MGHSWIAWLKCVKLSVALLISLNWLYGIASKSLERRSLFRNIRHGLQREQASWASHRYRGRAWGAKDIENNSLGRRSYHGGWPWGAPRVSSQELASQKKREFSVVPWRGFGIPGPRNLQSCKRIWPGKSPRVTEASFTHSFFLSVELTIDCTGAKKNTKKIRFFRDLNLMRMKTSRSLSNSVIRSRQMNE